MKQDEHDFLAACIAHWEDNEIPERVVGTRWGHTKGHFIRDYPMNEKRKYYLLHKWRFYDYGVTFDLGWCEDIDAAKERLAQ